MILQALSTNFGNKLVYVPHHEKTRLCHKGTTKAQIRLPFRTLDQTALLHSLISAFVVHCLDSTVSVLAKSKMSKTLDSLCSWAGWFEFYLVAIPEDRFSHYIAHMSCYMTKPTKWLGPQRRLNSALASAQSDQSLLCALWVTKDLIFLHADSEGPGWSESSLGTHSFCWFCHVAAHMSYAKQKRCRSPCASYLYLNSGGRDTFHWFLAMIHRL